MVNFLKETIECIEDNGHKESDIMFIGSYDGKYRMSWEKFKEKADFLYDNGYGAQHIARDLIVYFFDGSYMDRQEYDGSEWWEYHGLKYFKEEDEYEEFDVLGGRKYMWDYIENMN